MSSFFMDILTQKRITGDKSGLAAVRNRLTTALGAIAGFLSAASSGIAQVQTPSPPVIDPNGVVENFNIQTIAPVLAELGIPYQRRNQNGYDILMADIGIEGVTAIFWPRVCGATRDACAGLVMRAYYTGASNLELNNRFNLTTPPIAAMTDGSSVFAQRYLIGNYGVTRGSLAVNIKVFQDTARKYHETLTSAPSNFIAYGARDDASDAPAKIDNAHTQNADAHSDFGDGVFFSKP
ncbi:MAG: YbjN domain-containing protein [Pseudomonadota bacterium]